MSGGPGVAAPPHSRSSIKAHEPGCRHSLWPCVSPRLKSALGSRAGWGRHLRPRLWLWPCGHVGGIYGLGGSKRPTPGREGLISGPPGSCCVASHVLPNLSEPRCSLGPLSAIRTDPETSRRGGVSGREGLRPLGGCFSLLRAAHLQSNYKRVSPGSAGPPDPDGTALPLARVPPSHRVSGADPRGRGPAPGSGRPSRPCQTLGGGG